MNYDIDYLMLVKYMVKEKRYIHTLGVVETAIELSKRYNEDIAKARVAASLHDITKYFSDEDHISMMKKYYDDEFISNLPRGAYHAYSASIFAKDFLLIDDIDILNAIKYHTLARPNMSTLEKIIYISDFCEPNRDGQASRECRKIAKNSLDEALRFAIHICIIERENEGKYVPKMSYDALEFYNRK